MKKTFIVKVSTKHFKRSKGFGDGRTCPMAEALKDHFPDAKEIIVYITEAEVDGVMYTLTGWTVMGIINEPITVTEIETHVKNAKAGKRVPTYNVTVEQK